MFNQILGPMLLKEIDKPFNNANYLYELKYDGIRALIYVSKNKIRVLTRNGKDVSGIYPELTSIQRLVGDKKVIFDGEIVAFSKNKPSFQKLSLRHHLKNKAMIDTKKEEIPVCFMAFDILYEDKDLTHYPLIKRKEILNHYPDNEQFVKSMVYENGILLFKQVKKKGLEGIIAKEKNSIYIPNKRVDSWIKIKNFQKEKFIVHGFIKLKEKYSLFLGEYKNKELIYVGKVSITKDNPILKKVMSLKPINNKFVNFNESGHYIEPKLKIFVHYMERTNNHTLRQPFIKA